MLKISTSIVAIEIQQYAECVNDEKFYVSGRWILFCKRDVRVPRCGKTSRVWSKIKARVFGLGEKYEEVTL